MCRHWLQVAYAQGIPFPLSYIIPAGMRRAVCKHFDGMDGAKMYCEALEALDALGTRLQSRTGGDFFFGSRPSSLGDLMLSALALLLVSQGHMRGTSIRLGSLCCLPPFEENLLAHLHLLQMPCFSAA